jgi:hypothetical protein
MPQIVPGLPEVKDAVAQAMEKDFPEKAQAGMSKKLAADGKTEKEITQAVEGKKRSIAGPIEQAKAANATKMQEIGGLLGRGALAFLIVVIASRRTVLRIFLLPGLIVMPVVFGWAAVTSLDYLQYGMVIAGFLTVAQFSFWGNYLPLVYPVHLRGTGESFAANIGGRLIGTSFAAVTQFLAPLLPFGASAPNKVAFAAAIVAFTVYLVNFIASFYLPEPKPEAMSE